MKTLLMAALFASVALPAAADCIKTAAGRTICRDASGHVVAAPPAAAPASGAVVVAPGAAAAPAPGAVVVPRPAARAYESPVTTVQRANGGRAAYNPRTGNAAVSETNAHGVTTTQTTRGGEAKTKNGMGVAHGPGGKTCVKGKNQAGCN